MRTKRRRKVFFQGHRAHKWQRQDLSQTLKPHSVLSRSGQLSSRCLVSRNIQSSPPTLQLGHQDFKLGIRGMPGCWPHLQSGKGARWVGTGQPHTLGQDTHPEEGDNGLGGGDGGAARGGGLRRTLQLQEEQTCPENSVGNIHIPEEGK